MKHVRIRHDGHLHEGTLADETIHAGELSLPAARERRGSPTARAV